LSKLTRNDWPSLLASTDPARTVRYSKNSLTIPHPSLIFVHGLTGDREKTWTAKDATEPWPKTLLPSKVPTARILTFGYDAYVSNWRGMVSKNRVGNHAMNLLAGIASYREEDDTVCLYDSFYREGSQTHSRRTTAPSYSSATAWEALCARM
jgi:hypothetical protein